ncbi:MAG: NAD-dependent epimerase/dehydratase family protein [Rhodospirillales bacterium]|nr:NAD-dependent epimerase/dehydratase family protein [Rhodospirillales bacterium]
MRRAVVTGAAGFVGRTLAPVLRDAGWQVVATTRNASAFPPLAGVEVCGVGGLGPDTDWSRALPGADAVVHLAARVHVSDRRRANDPEFHRVNAAGTRRLAEEAAKAGIRRFLYVSTANVNGEQRTPEPFNELDPARPDDPYSQSKLAGEAAVLDVGRKTGMGVVVLRPPLVYGPGVGANFLLLLKGCAQLPLLPFGGIANRRSLIFVGNFVDAIRTCLEHPKAAGQVFLVRDGENLSTPELVRRLARALGRSPAVIPVPAFVLRAAATLLGKRQAVRRLLHSLAVDDGKIRRELGWTPPFTVEEGLRETAAWFMSRTTPGPVPGESGNRPS